MEEDRYTRITLRLPRELHARLDAIADKTSKSLNAEIVGRLEASFGADGQPMSATLLRELQRTQQLLTLNRLEAAYRMARDAELLAQRAMADAVIEDIGGPERSRIELEYQGARSEARIARDELEGFKNAVPLVEAERDRQERMDSVFLESKGSRARVKLIDPSDDDETLIYNKVIIEREKPVVSKPPTNRGPARSPNAHKPKP